MSNKREVEFRNRLVILAGVSLAFILFLLTSGFAAEGDGSLSNESQQSLQKIGAAELCLEDLVQRGLPTSRANESLQEAKQLYAAQKALEVQGRSAKYELVVNYAEAVCEVKDSAFKAADEFIIFNQTYTEAAQRINIEPLQGEYNAIIVSLNEERFEETSVLIDRGYNSLASTEASQTTVNLFYSTTKNTLRSFFMRFWKVILVVLAVLLLLVFIFWRVIQRMRVRAKLRNLTYQKAALNSLIKKLQYSYFESKNISETEFKVKLQRFKEMIRDIDRQIPLLNAEIVKLSKNKSAQKVISTPRKRQTNVKVRNKSSKKVKKR